MGPHTHFAKPCMVKTQTHDLQGSLYSGSVVARDGSHHIIFLSERCLDFMRQASILFADGTFKITPAVDRCYQIFTIVTICMETVIPLAWVLMENKPQLAYIAVLIHIRARLRQWNFNRVVTDFEDAMINAFEIVFAIEVQGCYFHSVNAMGSWARCHITVRVLQTFPVIATVVRYCCTLPLLPQHLLQRGFDVIDAAPRMLGPFLYLIVLPFLTYVQNDWLLHPNRGRTLSVSGSEHRTNNASESNNGRMNRRVKVHNPNVFHLIRNFANFEATSVDDVFSLQFGIIPSRPRSARFKCLFVVILL